jgi:NADPH:quinone reductase-like Zn-dependent oxidoreductase
MMKAYRLTRQDLDGLIRTDELDPTPRPNEVLVRIRAASLNYKDLFFVRPAEQHGLALPRPTIPISDGAGEIVAVGSEVADFGVGDRVAANVAQNWIDGVIPADAAQHALGYGIDGILCQFRALDAAGVVRLPDDYSYEQGSTLPIAGVTAWNAIRRVSPGESVLVLGTGGVAVFALQFAKAQGAKVILTSSSAAKIARAVELGADHGINYRTNPSWEEEVKELTGGRGVDHVIETVGGRSVEQSVEATAIGGRIHMIGLLDFQRADTSGITEKAITVQGIRFGSRGTFEDMVRFINKSRVVPVIDSVFKFDDAISAYRHLDSKAHFGKIVIDVD